MLLLAIDVSLDLRCTKIIQGEPMRFMRLKEIKRLTGLSRSTLVRLEREGLFPSRRRIGQSAVGWLEREVVDWLDSRPREATK